MNEIIRKLAEKATVQVPSHGAFGEPTVNEYVELEKFAELIVQECIGIAEEYQNRGGNCYVSHKIAEAFDVTPTDTEDEE